MQERIKTCTLSLCLVERCEGMQVLKLYIYIYIYIGPPTASYSYYTLIMAMRVRLCHRSYTGGTDTSVTHLILAIAIAKYV